VAEYGASSWVGESARFRALGLLCFTMLVSGCGAGSEQPNSIDVSNTGSSSDQSDTELGITAAEPETFELITPSNVIPPLVSGPVHGFLNIEERSGKRVLDGWFINGAVQSTPSEPLSSVTSGDVCTPVSTAIQSSGYLRTSRAADAIELVSRSGVQARLEYFHISDAVVYASTERWLRDAIHDDTQIRLIGNPQLESLDSPMLSSLMPLILKLPLRPVLENATAPIEWEPSDHPDDRLVLTVWQKSRSETTGLNQTWSCSLEDDGRFVLADAMPTDTVSNGSAYAFRMRRERRTERAVDTITWSIVQSSLVAF